MFGPAAPLALADAQVAWGVGAAEAPVALAVGALVHASWPGPLRVGPVLVLTGAATPPVDAPVGVAASRATPGGLLVDRALRQAVGALAVVFAAPAVLAAVHEVVVQGAVQAVEAAGHGGVGGPRGAGVAAGVRVERFSRPVAGVRHEAVAEVGPGLPLLQGRAARRRPYAKDEEHAPPRGGLLSPTVLVATAVGDAEAGGYGAA